LATHIVTFILGASRLDNQVFSPYRELSALRATALWAHAFISELKVMMSGVTPISNGLCLSTRIIMSTLSNGIEYNIETEPIRHKFARADPGNNRLNPLFQHMLCSIYVSLPSICM
jgi:hypothetical protein